MERALPSPQSPLFGRDSELGILRAQFAEVLTGRGSLVLISGGAGIGKTALADQLGRDAAGTGARILTGHCYDGSETPPYGPWFETFAQVGAADHGQYSSAPVAPDLTAATSQEDVFARVQSTLTTLAAQRPTVLILEDLHWADAASLDLLRIIARTLASLPLLLIVTYRANELGRHHPLHALVPLLVREAPAVRLDLRPLDVTAARALVDTRYALPDEEATRLAAHLIARTEGNALFMTELLRTLEEERLLHRDGDRWYVAAITDAPVPLLLKQVIDTRLARFGDESAALLAIAAVIGQEIPLPIWEAVTLADEETLIALTEGAEAAHLLISWANGAGVRFAHTLIRDVLYESVPPFQRRRLHRQVGDVLAGRPASDPDAVAHHFQRAGDTRAAAWLTRAGERAEDAYALTTAAERYEAAFALLDAQQGDPRERGWLRLLAAAPRIYEQPDRAFRWVEEAVELATEGEDTSLAARAQALHGLLLRYRGQFRAGMAALAAASVAADQLPPGTGIARRREQQIDRMANRGTLTSSLAYVGQLAEARALGERHLARATAATTPAEFGTLADLQAGLSMVYVLQGEVLLAQQAYAACVAAYAVIGHHLLTFAKQREEFVLRVLPYLTDDLAGRERALATVEREALHLLKTGACHDPTLPTQVRIPLLALEGHWREARQIAEQPDAFDFAIDTQLRLLSLGQLARAQGDAARAWQCVHEVWPEGPTTEPGVQFVQHTLPLQRLAAALALDAGDLATARVWLDAHDRWLTWMGATLGLSEGQALEAAWHRASGDLARARDHAELALEQATTPRQPLALLAAHRTLGSLDTEAGQTAQAAAHFAAALALATACRAPYERALTLLARAELAITNGDGTAAGADLAEVRAICTPLGALPTLARAKTLMARLPRSNSAPSTRPGDLSEREAEVLRLVAAGLTNAQVAGHLFVSPRTINGHLTNIYAKLGVEGRAAAIRIALERGLR